MHYFVYILYSPKLDQFYKGQTNNLEERLVRHNHGWETSTKKGTPWKLVWSTQKETRAEAIQFETKLKNLSRNRLIQLMLKYSNGIASHDEFLLLQKLSRC